jgi:hypothetical protein
MTVSEKIPASVTTNNTIKPTVDIITTETINTTTTTAIVLYCGQSCLNQSWINTSDGLAWWPFYGSYLDSTGIYNGYPSPNLPTFVTGYIGQAASFNASAKQAMYTSFIPLNNVSFTVEAWIQPTGYPNPTDHSIVGLCPSATANHCLHINIRSKKLHFGFYFNDARGTTTILLNQWIHTAFVFDISIKKQTIYLNGIQDGAAYVSSAFAATSGNFTIGVNERVVTTTNNFQVRWEPVHRE